MKKIYFLCLLSAAAFTSQAQSDSVLRELDSSRKVLANSGMVYPYIDTPPGYVGGNTKWSAYVTGSNLITKAIDLAKKQNAPAGKYTVVVKFAVNADGTVGDVKTVNKPVGYGLEEAAIKLVQGSGKWVPANVEGKNTKAYLNLPVVFEVTRN